MSKPLSEIWLADQRAAFAAAILGDSPDVINPALAEPCIEVLQGTYALRKVLSEPTLSLIEAIEYDFDREIRFGRPNGEPSGIRPVTMARDEIALREGEARTSALFIANAALLLRHSQLDWESLIDWFRIGQSAAGLGNILGAASDGLDRLLLGTWLQTLRDADGGVGERLRAIDQLHDSVSSVISSRKQIQILWVWTRICLAARNALYARPLLVIEHQSGDDFTGLTLPLRCSLAQRDSLVNCEGFSVSEDWREGLRRGREAGVEQWRSQTRTLAHRDLSEACLEVDFCDAAQIIAPVFGKEQFPVTGPSATLYWSLIIQSLLLGDEIPAGLATGTIEADNFTVGGVEGIKAKLFYAHKAAVARVVIPAANAQDADAFFCERNQFEQSTQTETNRCASIRNATDTMLPSFWRRGCFPRLPEMRKSFLRWAKRGEWSVLAQRSARLVQAKVDDALNEFGVARVQVEWSADTEGWIGPWLAWLDKQARPGQRFIALRSAEGDHPLRLWAALAHILGASEDWWHGFRHAKDSATARERLFALFNASGAAGTATDRPGPHCIVILDESGISDNKQISLGVAPHLDLHPLLLDGAGSGTGERTGIRFLIVRQERPKASNREEEPLRIFRQSFTAQIGYGFLKAINCFDDSWEDFQVYLGEQVKGRKLVYHGAHYWFADRRVELPHGDGLQYARQWEAALALCPILAPVKSTIAGNRDDQLEPGQLAEARHHLIQARKALLRWKPRDMMERKSILADAFHTLTLLAPYPDWDLVHQLLRDVETARTGVRLAESLLRRTGGHEVSPAMWTYYCTGLCKIDEDGDPALLNSLLACGDFRHETGPLQTQWLSVASACGKLGLEAPATLHEALRSIVDAATNSDRQAMHARERNKALGVSETCWNRLWNCQKVDADKGSVAFAAALATSPIAEDGLPGWHEPWVWALAYVADDLLQAVCESWKLAYRSNQLRELFASATAKPLSFGARKPRMKQYQMALQLAAGRTRGNCHELFELLQDSLQWTLNRTR